ncbi:MAG: sulfotransferase domain-containing protein [Gammaproteobacteria bacterium]
MLHLINKRLTKWFVRWASAVLPEARGHDLERWRRGREDYWKYRRCDYVFASYGKSGRTWVRVMISRYFKNVHQLPDGLILGFDNFHKLNRQVPKIFFTHDNYLRQYLGHGDTREDFYDYRTLLLVRKPQDVAVSQFFQWKFRMRPYKKALNNYPAHGEEISMFDFVMHEHQGLPRIIRYLNEWNSELAKIPASHVVRYEDLRSEPEKFLAGVMDFMGETVDAEAIRESVEFSSVKNLRKMESENYFWRSGSRVQARDKNNPESFKVRKAKVGGYRDYFDDAQLAKIDALVDEKLNPGFGYTSAENAESDERPARCAL